MSEDTNDKESANQKLLRLELREELAQLLEKRLTTEKERLRTAWSLVSRPLIVAATLITGGLGLLGYQGWKDISDRIDKAVEARVDLHLKHTSPTIYERGIERLYDEALLQTYISSIPRSVQRHKKWLDQRPSLNDTDVVRLINLLANESTPEAQCERVLLALRYTEFDRSLDAQVTAPLRNLLNTEPVPTWLSANPKRWEYSIRALSVFHDVSLASRFQALLSKNTAPPLIAVAALDYLREAGAVESTSVIEEYVKRVGPSSVAYVPSLRSLASLAPNSSTLKSLVAASATPSSTTATQAAALLVIASELSSNNQNVDGRDTELNEALALSALEAYLATNFRMYLEQDRVFVRKKAGARDGYQLPIDYALSFGLELTLEKLVDRSLNSSDLSRLRRIVVGVSIFDNDHDKLAGIFKVRILDSMTLNSDLILIGHQITDGVYLEPNSGGLTAHWLDLSGNVRSLVLKKTPVAKYARPDIVGLPSWWGNRRSIASPFEDPSMQFFPRR